MTPIYLDWIKDAFGDRASIPVALFTLEMARRVPPGEAARVGRLRRLQEELGFTRHHRIFKDRPYAPQRKLPSDDVITGGKRRGRDILYSYVTNGYLTIREEDGVRMVYLTDKFHQSTQEGI